jgi:protein-ribulosamine 3-kinase
MNILKQIELWAGSRITSQKLVGGGSIAQSVHLQIESGDHYFLKSGSRNKNMFPAEAHGLQELEKSNSLKVPHVYLVDENFLLLEFIHASQPSGSFFKEFGHQFAQLHRTQATEFGFYENNFIGHTPQINLPKDKQKKDWIVFYFENRLLYQFKLAEENGFSSQKLRDAFYKLEGKINFILSGSEKEPVLLHGDLWSGNFLAADKNIPVVIDPAVYYGNREADLAMTKLFGGFSSSFYSAYNETYPFAAGYEYRENIYKLYHVLNHLNLFGMGYHSQAVDLIQSYL